jgi:prefoldin subunit 5
MSIQTDIQIRLHAYSDIREEINAHIGMIDHGIEELERAAERIANMKARRLVLLVNLAGYDAAIAALKEPEPAPAPELQPPDSGPTP